MSAILKHKYFAFALAIMIVTLPLFLIIMQQQQEIRGRAEKSTSLYFSPITNSTNPIIKKIGEPINLDLMVNPGVNLVSLIKAEITYDPTKLRPSEANPLSINQTIFPAIIEGPVYSDGKIQIVLSVGPDLSKAVGQISRVATLNFDTITTSSQTLVSFGINTSISSVAQNDASNENVLSTTSPAYIKISKTSKGSPGGGKDRK